MSTRFRIGELDVDLQALEVRDRHGVRKLEPRAAAVLERLARTPGEVVSREELIAAVWGHPHVSKDALAVAVHRLRQTLGESPNKPGEDSPVETVPRRGYRLVVPDSSTSRKPTATRMQYAAAALAAVLGIGLALAIPRQMPTAHPDGPAAMLARAEALWERQEPAAARRAVAVAEAARDAAEDDAELGVRAHALLGRFYGYKTADWLGLERPEAAARGRAHLDRALALAPRDPGVLTTAASFALYTERDPDRARYLAEDALDLDPGRPSARQVLAKAAAAQGDAATAVATIRRLAEEAPADGSVHWDRAFILFLAGEHAASLRALETAVSLSPRDPYWLQAFNLHAMGHPAEAAAVWADRMRRGGCQVTLADDPVESFGRLLAVEEDCGIGFAYHRGLWAFETGDFGLARRYFEVSRANDDYMFIWDALNPLPHGSADQRLSELGAGAAARESSSPGS